MNDFKVSNLDDNEETTFNIIAIVFNTTFLTYNGNQFSLNLISDNQLGETNFPNLKRPGMIEIPSSDSKVLKTIMVSGGLDSTTNKVEKMIYLINIIKIQENEFILELNFKYSDIPSPKYLHNLVLLNNRFILSCGGKNENSWLSSCEVFDLKIKKWELFPNLKDRRANFDLLVMNTNQVFAFGGYSDFKKLSVPQIEMCKFSENIQSNKWIAVILKGDICPLACMRIIEYCDSILVFGGFDGQKMQDIIYEIDLANKEVKKIGKLNSSRGNFHLLRKNDDIYVLGGTCAFKISEDESIINYGERLSIGFGNKITNENITMEKQLINNLNNGDEYFDAGFPYNSSIIINNLKEFN